LSLEGPQGSRARFRGGLVKPIEALSAYVRTRRGELGLTQQQLADRAGVTRALIGHLEAGRLRVAPQLPNLKRLATGLGVEFQVLLDILDTGKMPD